MSFLSLGEVKVMKEIGGYIELDNFSGQEYHKNAVALNCARNCLAYLIESKKISKLFVPYYLCYSVMTVAAKYEVACEYYNVNEKFKPILDVSVGERECVYIVNYYGMLTDSDIENYKLAWKNIIVDNTQDFFREPKTETYRWKGYIIFWDVMKRMRLNFMKNPLKITLIFFMSQSRRCLN